MIDKNSHVLVVDDMKMARFLVVKGLNDLGYKNTIEAEDGEIAWNMINDPKYRIGLILCDWNMPKLNGLELLKKLKANAKFKTLPFIMVTAESERPQIETAMNAGSSDYMVKPFEADLLRQKIIKL